VFTGCDPPCPPEQYCKYDFGVGTCVCPDHPTTRYCDGACVDTNSDPNHCGECRLACDAGTACLVTNCWTLDQLFDALADVDNVYLGYTVEELWDPEAAAALPDPPDDEFVPVSEPSGVALEYGDGGASVELPPFEEGTIPAAKGTLAESSAERRLYALDNGWAGGTLELRIESGRVVADLTVFGSGLPVVYAHRGTLVVAPQ